MYSLSIIIVSKNRSDQLAKTVKGIRRQNMQPLEIIIIDDSDAIENINANKLLAKECDCTYIQSSGKGLFVNRNLGAMYSKGTHIRTVDDDHEMPEGHLEICMKAIAAEPETIWTIGEHYPFEKIRTAPHPVPGQLHPRGYGYRRYKENQYYGISDGATIYPRSIIDKKILNCELYPFGLTYLEYGARLKNKGYQLKPLSNTYIIHHNIEQTASKIPAVMQESRIFAMFCLSFSYQPTLKNKAETIIQLLLDFFRGKTKFLMIKSAYRNYKRFTAHI